MLPPLEKFLPAPREHDDAHRGIAVECREAYCELVALCHRHDVEWRPVKDDVGALGGFVPLDAESVARRERCGKS